MNEHPRDAMKDATLRNQKRICQSDLLGARARKLPSPLTRDEVEAHFEHMPLRYWGSFEQKSILWHLESLHSFFVQLVRPKAKSIDPVVRWKHHPEKKYSEVLVCTWDRLGLFSKVAGSFALSGMNILSADIYTRNDNLVLDLFKVCDLKGYHVSSRSQIQKMVAALNRSLNGKSEVPFSTIFQKKSTGQRRGNVRTAVSFNNQASHDYTILKLKTPDHHGLLYSVLQVITLNGFDIAQAKIATQGTMAVGEFYITDTRHRKVMDRLRLDTIRDLILEMVRCLGSRSAV